jgi:hypothetical protein
LIPIVVIIVEFIVFNQFWGVVPETKQLYYKSESHP